MPSIQDMDYRTSGSALSQLDEQIAEALKNLDKTDTLEADLWGEEESFDRLPESIAELKKRREMLAKLTLRRPKAWTQRGKENGSTGHPASQNGPRQPHTS